ncbi:hypothetical protein Emag_000346 [Eimeria magna]
MADEDGAKGCSWPKAVGAAEAARHRKISRCFASGASQIVTLHCLTSADRTKRFDSRTGRSPHQAGSRCEIAFRRQLSRRRAGLLLRRQRGGGATSSSPIKGEGLAGVPGVRFHKASAAMHPSCRWFVAAGCWLMACLVAPGAFRVAAALSVPRSAAAAAASSFGFRSSDDCNGGRSLGGESGFFAGSMPRAATNAAAAAAAAAALAALATGTLSLGLEGRSAAAPVSPATAESLQRRRDRVLAALDAAFGPHAASGAFRPLASRAPPADDLLHAKQEQQPSRLAAAAAAAAVAAAAAAPSVEPPGLVSSVKQGALFGFDTLKQGALSLCREGGEMAACTLKALQAWRRWGPWAPLGAVWRWRLGAKGLILRRIDAGGGGDCLFHSVALSLTARGVPASSLLLRRIAADGAVGLKACEPGAAQIPRDIYLLSQAACNLKQQALPLWVMPFTLLFYLPGPSVCHSVLTPKEETLFLERLGVMAALEAADEWQDGWSPSAVLESEKEYVATTDICALEDSLDVGIIVMDDSTGKIYPTACDRKLRKHYMFLYFVTPDGHKSLFTPEELPPALIKLFEEDTKNALFPRPWASDSVKTFTNAKVESIGAPDHPQIVSTPST